MQAGNALELVYHTERRQWQQIQGGRQVLGKKAGIKNLEEMVWGRNLDKVPCEK